MFLPSTRWARFFFAAALAQGLVALGLETYVFITVENDLSPAASQVKSGHTVPMYFALFIFSYLYGLAIVYEALRLNSMIEVTALCIYNLLLLAYAAVQPQHVKTALDTLSASLTLGVAPVLPPELHTWERISPALRCIIVVQVAATAALSFMAFKLHSEFAWLVYKVIHADLSMRRRLLTFQLYIALIKFDFFVFLGFLVQTITLIVNQTDIEFALSIAGVFVTVGVMVAAIYCATVEHRTGTVAVIVSYVCAVVYLCYKMTSLFTDTNYILVIFAATALFLMICTILMAIVCLLNFDQGLKAYTMPQKKLISDDIYLRSSHSTQYLAQSPRMDLVD